MAFPFKDVSSRKPRAVAVPLVSVIGNHQLYKLCKQFSLSSRPAVSSYVIVTPDAELSLKLPSVAVAIMSDFPANLVLISLIISASVLYLKSLITPCTVASEDVTL